MPCTNHAFYLITTFVLLVLMSKLDGSSKLSRMMLIMLSILFYKSYEQLLKPCPSQSFFDPRASFLDMIEKIECQKCKANSFNNTKENTKDDNNEDNKEDTKKKNPIN